MISIEEYKNNPCRVSSIPYWKVKTFKTPSNISIVHNDDFKMDSSNLYVDKQYFRVKHNLKSINSLSLDNMFTFRYVDTNSNDDLEEVVNIINNCYIDIKVDLNRVSMWTKIEVFDKDLWIFIIDVNKQLPIALGIAEFDKTVREGMLEWIQVLPEYRNRKLGQALVNKLLDNLKEKVEFVTVSGQVNNNTNPEKLYRRCGFEGSDVWHIMVKK